MKLCKKIKYKTIERKEITSYKKQLLEFYNHYFPEKSNKKIVDNCSAFFIAMENDLIIGCCRLLTDYSRNGILFDLIVWEKRRNKGIGTKLTRNALKYCREKSIKKVYLMTDPRHDWLKNFYKRLGFKVPKKQILMKIVN